MRTKAPRRRSLDPAAEARRTLSRRRFLQAAGLGAGAAFLPSLARGQAAPARPRRIVFVLSELGWNPAEFRMAPPGAPAEVLLRSAYHPAYSHAPDTLRWELPLSRTPRERFSPTLEPLYDLRDRVLALDGLGMLSIGADHLGDAHARGWNHALSGHPAGEFLTGQRAVGGAPSIDARIARHLRAQEPHLTDLAVLRMKTDPWWSSGGTDGFHHWFHDYTEAGDMVRVPVTADPRALYARLFPSGSAPGEAPDPVAAGQRNVLDALQARYAAVFPNLSRDDRNKLLQHQQRIRDIQDRLARLEASACEAPAEPVRRGDHGTAERMRAGIDAFMELTVTAMACDITRVACLHLGNGSADYRAAEFGADDRDFHEWYSHGTNPPNQWRGVEGANVSQAEFDKFQDAAPVLARKNRYHAAQVARLAARMAEIPDGDGTLLDHTAIVLMDEISHGSHGHDQWPVVLVGGFGGGMRTGRYVRFPRDNPNPGINGMRYVGTPHSHLLVSLCQGMGLELDHLGLDHVYAREDFVPEGKRISLTGPLPELT